MFLLSSHIASSARWIMSSACSPLATAWSPPSRSVGYRYMIHVRLVPPEAEYISNIYIYVWVNKYIYIYIYRIYVHQYTYIIIHHSSYTQLYTHSNLYKYINYVYIYIYTTWALQTWKLPESSLDLLPWSQQRSNAAGQLVRHTAAGRASQKCGR